jgi:hypothetical protein
MLRTAWTFLCVLPFLPASKSSIVVDAIVGVALIIARVGGRFNFGALLISILSSGHVCTKTPWPIMRDNKTPCSTKYVTSQPQTLVPAHTHSGQLGEQ